MDEADYRRAAYALLPPGDAWPEQPGEFPEIDALINAWLPSLVAVDVRADDLVTESVIAESEELLPNWEEQYGLPDEYSEDGATVAQRRADILAKRRKRTTPSLPALRPVVADFMAGAVLSHHLHPAFVAGESGSGEACGDSGEATWSLECMPDILAQEGSELDTWESVGATVFADQDPRPNDAAVVMDEIAFSASDALKVGLTCARSTDGAVRFVLWAKTDSVTALTLTIHYEKRDGTLSTAQDYVVCDTWAKLVYEANIGVGATAPKVVVTSAAGGVYILGDAHAGERYPKLEARAARLFQLQTEGEFLVHGEGPVSVYDESGNPLFTDDGDPITL
jgi:hypothetical protein